MDKVMNKLIKDFLRNDIFYITVIIFISLLIFWRPLFSEGYPSWADNSSQEVLNMQRFSNMSNFTYAEHANGLIYNTNVILTYFMISKVFVILSKLSLDTEILSFLWVFLPYLVLYLCLYFSLRNIFGEKRISFVLTLFYIFSLHNFIV